MYGLSGIQDCQCVAVYGDRVDAFEARAESDRAQRSNAAWLELADDTTGLSASERSRRAMRRVRREM
jgi:hypothetical protein